MRDQRSAAWLRVSTPPTWSNLTLPPAGPVTTERAEKSSTMRAGTSPAPSRPEVEGTGTGVERAEGLGQKEAPAGEGDVARAGVAAPAHGARIGDAPRLADHAQNPAERGRQARDDAGVEQVRIAAQLQVHTGELQPRQRRIPADHRHPAVADIQIAGRQIVEGQRRGAPILAQLDLRGEREGPGPTRAITMSGHRAAPGRRTASGSR